MSFKVNLKEDPITKESYIDINDLSEFFEDVSLVDKCEMKELEDKSISLVFYDKDGNVIKLKTK